MSAVSTRNLTVLPPPAALERLCQSLALLDAILMPDWEHRYYSFNSAWDDGERMASMRDGEGDDWFLLFGSNGAFLKGFAHECAFGGYCLYHDEVYPGVIDDVPQPFEPTLNEAAFTIEYTTFCVWRSPSDDAWQVGDIEWPEDEPDPDGSEQLLALLSDRPADYVAWASAHYEHEVPLAPVERIYRHEALTQELLSELNSELQLDALAEDLAEIGYPVAT